MLIETWGDDGFNNVQPDIISRWPSDEFKQIGVDDIKYLVKH